MLSVIHEATAPHLPPLCLSYSLTSAMMNPFSKSVWIFPAAWGALVPFCRLPRKWENMVETVKERTGKVTHKDGYLQIMDSNYIPEQLEVTDPYQTTVRSHLSSGEAHRQRRVRTKNYVEGHHYEDGFQVTHRGNN